MSVEGFARYSCLRCGGRAFFLSERDFNDHAGWHADYRFDRQRELLESARALSEQRRVRIEELDANVQQLVKRIEELGAEIQHLKFLKVSE